MPQLPGNGAGWGHGVAFDDGRSEWPVPLAVAGLRGDEPIRFDWALQQTPREKRTARASAGS
ncbi:hypothetical protein [Polaromonas sp.]|uniref:hypothetical protein n=1 Tax=Polaromonas sp. TaxID=1869339 RepID=UPI0018392E6A|nr:hypothetical protein [Polaromonas sp.]NMM05901.1 hypothetical protein [Polaromonas sp.]